MNAPSTPTAWGLWIKKSYFREKKPLFMVERRLWHNASVN
jgi:hypothetical protein